MTAEQKKAARDAAVAAAKAAEQQKRDAEAPQAETTEAPQVETTEAPQVANVEAPQAETTEAPQVETTEAPQVENVEAPQDEAEETAKVREFMYSKPAVDPEWEDFKNWQQQRATGIDAIDDALSGRMPLRAQESESRTIGDDMDGKRKAHIASLELEILELDLMTKKVLYEQTVETNTSYKQTKEQRLRAAEQAQTILNAAFWTQKQIEAGCDHATGGFGMEDIYQGDNKPSIVAMELPIPGRRVILCYRCLKTVTTPDPNLRFTDLDAYLVQMADYKEFVKLERKSLSKPLGGPVFKFERDGKPVDPVLV